MTPENEAKKQYLLRYRQAEREIRLLHEELAQLESMAVRVTPSYSGEAHGSGSGSRVESATEKINDCKAEINQATSTAMDIRREVMAAIATVPDGRLRELLRRRYILGQKWEQIAWEMDLEFRQTFHLHNRALTKLTIETHISSVL